VRVLLVLLLLLSSTLAGEPDLERARVALEEHRDDDAIALIAGRAIDRSRIEAERLWHGRGMLARGSLEVAVVASDLAPISVVGPLVSRLLPEHVLGVPLARPFAATLEDERGALVLRGYAPRAFGHPLVLAKDGEAALEHEGLPSRDAYFGFDVVTPEEENVQALYALTTAEGNRVELQLVDGNGHRIEHVKTGDLRGVKRLRLVAGTPCRLLADGIEVLRLKSRFAPGARERVRPVLAVAVGGPGEGEGRFGKVALSASLDPTWLERATARERAAIASELGLEPARARRETGHFVVETDLGPASLEAFAQDLEAALARFEKMKPTKGFHCSVTILGTDEAYRAAVDRSGHPEEKLLGGFFVEGAIVMKTEEKDPRPRLAHEAFHAYATNALGDLPVWLSEGLAEREALRFAQVPAQHNRRPLEEARRHPREWKALLAASPAEFHDRGARAETGQRSGREKRNYLLSWSLCEIALRKPDSLAAKLVTQSVTDFDEVALDAEWLDFVLGASK
jgi:hypothetical protein